MQHGFEYIPNLDSTIIKSKKIRVNEGGKFETLNSRQVNLLKEAK